MKEDIMNKTGNNEFKKKSKLNGVYLHSRKGKSLASVLVFMKVSNRNSRTGR